MSQQKRKIFQLFLSVIKQDEEVVSASELVKRVETQKLDWLTKPEYGDLLRHQGLCTWARMFCQRYGSKDEPTDENEDICFATDEEREAAELEKLTRRVEATTGFIDDQYLLGFMDLRPWEKTAAKKFKIKSAFLPDENGHKEVCRMTPQERVDAGKVGIKTGTDTVARFKVLKGWGIRGGGVDKKDEATQ